ncbi:MAG: Omp28-related outer membrane protein [Bacteroidales bacterium]|nr:Omp28-related outer membrane protein [Bacteroidales bacterium]
MKKIIILSLAVVFAGIFSVSCDKIEEGEYIKEGSDIWYGRKIVVFDFTGHKCGNCPKGHKVINSLEEKYGKAVVPIAVHCTYYGNTKPNSTPPTTDTSFNYDFRCEEGMFLGGGDTDGGYMDIEGLPAGLVNSLNPVLLNNSPNGWASDFTKYYSTYPEFSFEMSAAFADSTISADIKLKSEVVTSRKLSLVAYVVEDGIVGWQLDYNPEPLQISNYVHNHVLRTSFSGALGEVVKAEASQMSAGDIIEKSYSVAAKSDWNIANCKVVAFVYDSDTKEILQAEIVNISE